MSALQVQKEMNKRFAAPKPNHKKVYELFNQMNELREIEGLPFFTMPGLQARFNDTRKSH